MRRWSRLMFFGLIVSITAENITYTHSSTPVVYAEAKKMCEQENKTLITTATILEHTQLLEFITESSVGPCWLGLKLPENSMDSEDFQWIDERPVVWTHWDTSFSEPNYLDTDKCVVLMTDHWIIDWHTRPCDDTFEYICQARTTTLQPPSHKETAVWNGNRVMMLDKVLAALE